MKKNHKPSHSKLDLHADDLSKRLQQEEKIKDEHELTNEGTKLWYSLKLKYKLKWDRNYCIPTEGNLEKKAAILRKAINVITFDTRELYETNDFLVIIERLTHALNRLNADLGVPPYTHSAFSISRIHWTGNEDTMRLLAKLLKENNYIEKESEWLKHFSTNALDKVQSGLVVWLKNKYELQYLLRRLQTLYYIKYPDPTNYPRHFLVNGKPLKDLGGGKHDYDKLDTIEAIIDEIKKLSI
jgi:hypothetical protein